MNEELREAIRGAIRCPSCGAHDAAVERILSAVIDVLYQDVQELQ